MPKCNKTGNKIKYQTRVSTGAKYRAITRVLCYSTLKIEAPCYSKLWCISTGRFGLTFRKTGNFHPDFKPPDHKNCLGNLRQTNLAV